MWPGNQAVFMAVGGVAAGLIGAQLVVFPVAKIWICRLLVFVVAELINVTLHYA
ncbi:MAG: hypothetical protein V4568_09500 [Pseudomonadota bacterium]